jgi:hypothetical protein
MSEEEEEVKRERTWMYVQKPWQYEISCDICGGHNLEWSEWQGYIWCYDCKKDVRGDKGIFDGPIPVQVAKVLGMSFDIVDIKNRKVVKFEDEKEWHNATKDTINDPVKFEVLAGNNLKLKGELYDGQKTEQQ